MASILKNESNENSYFSPKIINYKFKNIICESNESSPLIISPKNIRININKSTNDFKKIMNHQIKDDDTP